MVGSTSQASFGLAPQEDHPEHYEESDAGTWVTIFGFPPSAASYILTQAGMWGHILEHKIPSQVIRIFLFTRYRFFFPTRPHVSFQFGFDLN